MLLLEKTKNIDHSAPNKAIQIHKILMTCNKQLKK